MLDPIVADLAERVLRRDLRRDHAVLRERLALCDTIRRFFGRYDVLLCPTLPVSSLDIGLNAPVRLAGRGPIAWSFYTYPFNLTGQPALSLPVGTATDGLSVGLQIVGRFLEDDVVVRAAAAIERHLR